MGNRLSLWILAGVVAGSLVGYGWPSGAAYLGPLGFLFLSLLKMVAVPLVALSVFWGIISLPTALGLGRLGLKAGLYYLATSLLAILTGIGFFRLLRPGETLYLQGSFPPFPVLSGEATFSEVFLKIVPENPFRAFAEGDFVSVLFFVILSGVAFFYLPGNVGRPLKALAQAGYELMLCLTQGVLRLAPLGLFALMVQVVGEMASSGRLGALTAGLGRYFLTNLLGLALHFFLTLPLILYLFTGRSPWSFFRALGPALLCAFSTASSSATIPLTLCQLRGKAGVSERVSQLVVPVGATVNMDGTALYGSVMVFFLAQAHGVQLGLLQQFQVVWLMLLASIGTAGIPMGSLVLIAVVLKTLGLPAEWMALVLPLDRILDMCRTSVNVWSDAVGAAVVDRLEGQ
ncbi:MAG: dicarboxylate/amino acid:cation symporter [Elusimicrobia bacterium]|nr:dicarboxylate/amino acid:cation symporter [Elusimicrobiota bacterium]